MLEFGTQNNEITENCSNAPFILSINDNADNRLKIVIALPRKGEKGENSDLSEFPDNSSSKVSELLMQCYPIYEDTDKVYEIIFERYIIYQCRDESYTLYDEREIKKGNYLIIFEKSKLLDYYKDVIFDFDYEETKNTRKHYGIYAENHIIDVISNEPPIIKKSKPIPVYL